MLHIPIILGTARKDRMSEAVANYVFAQAQSFDGIEPVLIDVREYATEPTTIPGWEENDSTKPWRDIAASADGFIVVVPEYNHGYPGELKLLLDQELGAYNHKPVAVVGVSAGMFGGARVIEHLHMIWRGVGLVHASTLYTPKVKELFGEGSVPTDEKYEGRVQKLLHELSVYANGLKPIREELVQK